jgi:hypothetical protein
MNAREKDLLKARLKSLNKQIFAAEKVKRPARNEALVKDLKGRANIIREWLDVKPNKGAGHTMSKAEFRKIVGKAPAPTTRMEIPDIETLKEVWPVLRKNLNVEIEAPKEVKEALIAMMKEQANNTHLKGFRI